MKEKKVKEKVTKGDFNFEGAKLYEVDFSGMQIESDLNFSNAVIRRSVWFNEAKIDGDMVFTEAKIGADVGFNRAKVGRSVRFSRAKIDRDIWFQETEIGGYGWFGGAEIGRNAWFNGAKIKGGLGFKDTKFRIPKTQEMACRKAKRICEEMGNRMGADYHFYREMEARRKQKNIIIRILELPIQYIFGYGTKWGRVLITWFSVVFGCAFLFWMGEGVEKVMENGVKVVNSLRECIYFSIVTATTLGYGDYHPKPGLYQGLASIEAIFGTFMWAAFIVIFARKYMR